MIGRREFISGLGSAATWPVVARAQQGERVRRIDVLMPSDENDLVVKTWVSAFTQALARLGWGDGRNVRMDVRWGRGDINRIGALAKELVGLQPDIIVTIATPATAAVQRETRAIPIVASVAEPAESSASMPAGRSEPTHGASIIPSRRDADDSDGGQDDAR